MQSRKLKFANHLIVLIKEIGKLAFDMKSENDMERVFGFNQARLTTILKQVAEGLPDALFEAADDQLLKEIETICAREFIFFQVQEKVDKPEYQNNLLRFIQVFSRDIDQRLKIKEG